MSKKLMLLEKKVARLEKALNEAEELLEKKSHELYVINQNLEIEILLRTRDLKIARDLAIRANLAKSQFLANMSHEIRTPLNGIIGFVELLLKSEMTPVQNEQLKIIQKSGDFLLNIISDILEFSKIEAGKVLIEAKPFHLKRCIEAIVDNISLHAYDKGLRFSLYLDEKIPKALSGDEGRIRQVLLNLIGNALKYTPSGEVGLNVKLNKIEGTTFNITFTVFDTGVGIPKEKLDSIFLPFEQADISDSRKYGGTGLGLTISQEIVNEMGGQISVESEEAKGTQFSFTLNLTTPNNSAPVYTSRDFKMKELVGLLLPFNSESLGLTDRLVSWNAQCFKMDSNYLNNKFCPGLNHSIIIDMDDLSQPKIEIEKILQLFPLVHIIALSAPNRIAELFNTIEHLPIDLLRKPVARMDLYDSIEQKLTIQKRKHKLAKSTHIEVLSQPIDFGSMRILVVEDNLINQHLILALLKSFQLNATIANDGKQAIEKLKINTYDLILMDCQMPIMDGFEATREIRKMNINTTVVALTANAYKQTKEMCFESGMNDFITKPIKSTELHSALHKYLKIPI